MLNISVGYRYFIYRGIADMRKGIDSLCGIVRNELDKDPLKGDVFIFFNRKSNQIKLLHWQGDGFELYCKRLERGRFELPKLADNYVSAQTLHFILSGVELSSVKQRYRYKMAG